MPEEIRIGEGAVGWTSRGRGEERGGGLVVGFVTRLSKWTNVLSDSCTFESNNNDSQVELRALFALASMNKQRVLTRTCYSYGILERVLTPARIRIRTRARVYLCIICELSSSRHNYKQKDKQEHTIFTQICRKRPTDPTPPSAPLCADPSCCSCFYCPIPWVAGGKRSYSSYLGWFLLVSVQMIVLKSLEKLLIQPCTMDRTLLSSCPSAWEAW